MTPHSVKSLILTILFFGLLHAVPLRITGTVPVSIDTLFLSSQFTRIERALRSDSSESILPVHILFYRTSELRKIGIRLPEWGGGGALGKDTIILPIDKQGAFYGEDISKIIQHELVHIALARAYGNLRIPRWFHEGLAMTLSGEISFEQQVQLSRAIVTRKLVSLDSMEYLNRLSRWRAEVAYSQCQFAVQFLIDLYGRDLLPELLEVSHRTRRFESACVAVFGLTTFELQKLLDKKMEERYRILFLIGDYSLVWLGIFVLSIVAFVVTLLRNRKKKRQLDEEESLGEEQATDDPMMQTQKTSDEQQP